MWSTSKLKLNCRDQSDPVVVVMKTKEDKDVIDCIDVVYEKNEAEPT